MTRLPWRGQCCGRAAVLAARALPLRCAAAALRCCVPRAKSSYSRSELLVSCCRCGIWIASPGFTTKRPAPFRFAGFCTRKIHSCSLSTRSASRSLAKFYIGAANMRLGYYLGQWGDAVPAASGRTCVPPVGPEGPLGVELLCWCSQYAAWLKLRAMGIASAAASGRT
jgi:hypothetical protein